MELLLLPLLLLLLSPPASSSSSNNYKYQCDWCPQHTTASLFPHNKDKEGLWSPDETSAACGSFMELPLPDGLHLAAASAAFGGCGACYQLRCRDRRLCSDDGVNVIVAKEKANGTGIGFLLTRDAFTAMATMSDQLAGLLDNLQVDFRRIPCEYKKNLAVRVEEEGSRNPGHLAVRFLYQGGLTDIAAVEIAEPRGGSTISMGRRRNKQGVVWGTARAPAGPLQLRLVVTAGSGGKWLRTALPADWRPGGVYDTGLRVTDVAVRACSRSCLDHNDEDELR